MERKSYFSKVEITILICSIALILGSFLIFDRHNYLNMIASIIGSVALIICAKANPLGQVFMIVFILIYAYISWTFRYYGEIITYLGMSLPGAIFALVSWLKNPSEKGRAEVKINSLKKKEILIAFIASIIITIAFYFILGYFNTKSLFISTLSVFTSFLAGYLTFRRCKYFTIAYAFNDIVLIVMWILATIQDIGYLSVVICFIVFLVNDFYGFISWSKMKKRQSQIDN